MYTYRQEGYLGLQIALHIYIRHIFMNKYKNILMYTEHILKGVIKALLKKGTPDFYSLYRVGNKALERHVQSIMGVFLHSGLRTRLCRNHTIRDSVSLRPPTIFT